MRRRPRRPYEPVVGASLVLRRLADWRTRIRRKLGIGADMPDEHAQVINGYVMLCYIVRGKDDREFGAECPFGACRHEGSDDLAYDLLASLREAAESGS